MNLFHTEDWSRLPFSSPGDCFPISLSDLLLLVCRNATDFYVLVLYPAAILNSLMSSGSFLAVSLGGGDVFYMYSIMSSAKSDTFACSFPIWIPFIYFFLV